MFCVVCWHCSWCMFTDHKGKYHVDKCELDPNRHCGVPIRRERVYVVCSRKKRIAPLSPQPPVRVCRHVFVVMRNRVQQNTCACFCCCKHQRLNRTLSTIVDLLRPPIISSGSTFEIFLCAVLSGLELSELFDAQVRRLGLYFAQALMIHVLLRT